MRRGGSTLQTNLVAAILDESPPRLVDARSFSRLLAEHLPTDRPLVLKTHKFDEAYRPQLAARRIKVCYVYRDLRDVVVSAANKYERSCGEILAGGMLNQLHREFQQWTGVGDVYVARYEDMMADLPAEIRRLANYLGCTLTAPRVSEIALRYSLGEVRRQQAAFDFDAAGAGAGADRFNPSTLVHRNHIHSGAEGQWRDRLGFAERAVIEAHSGAWLMAHGYRLSMAPLFARLSAGLWRWSGRLNRVLRRAGLRRG